MDADPRLKQIVEAALLAVGGAMTLDHLQELFLEEERPDKKSLREAIDALQEDYRGRGVELVEVGGGFRVNVRAELAPWVSRLWEERPARYSRAMLETLALIAYRQPITRGEIEDIRGVSVSSHIIKTMLEREWVRVIGHRDVPGRPALFATTRDFLTYFGLNSLNDLPSLQEIRDLDSINRELELEEPRPDQHAPAPVVVAIADDQDVSGADGETPDQTESERRAAVAEPIAADEGPRRELEPEDDRDPASGKPQDE